MVAPVGRLVFAVRGDLLRGRRRRRRRGFDTAIGILGLLASWPARSSGRRPAAPTRVRRVPRPRRHRPVTHRAVLLRVPAAWALTLGMLAVATRALPWRGRASGSALHAGDMLVGAANVLVSGALTAAVCVGLAALTGSRGPVMGLVLAFQLGAAPLLAQLDVLGNARLAIPAVAISRFGGTDGLVAPRCRSPAAIAIILAWAAAGLGAGLWRTRTQEI